MIAFAVALLLAPQDGPSFSCARARTPVEHAICADAALGRLDRRMADRYVAARRAFPASAREALAQDQRWFLGARDEWYENRDRWSDFPDLRGRMTDRAAFLSSIRATPSRDLVGRWRNASGVVEITRAGPNRLKVAINTANPVNARWLCDVSITGAASGGAVQGLADNDSDYRLRATVRDGVLRIEETRVSGRESYGPGYCGANGFVGGAYFRVGG